jgi:flavin-dependent dehydrogenase
MTAPDPRRALPMAFNRQPLYADGLLLVGDAGGMVNPFNGEGIDYALEAGRTAAEIIVQARARADDAGPDARARVVPHRDEGPPRRLLTRSGRGFAALIGKPEVMRLCVKYGLPITP